MPELPEVETTRQGIAPHCEGQTVTRVLIRNPSLRWPVPNDLPEKLLNQVIRAVDRRAKYLFLHLDAGTVIVHPGYVRQPAGDYRRQPRCHPRPRGDCPGNESERTLRFNDPRRFGCWLWADDCSEHPLIRDLGPEPLSDTFNGPWLFRLSRGKQTPIKSFIMDNHIVVGVGNIYANEALFKAGIHPKRKAGRISLDRYHKLAESIRETLSAAILMGGTTLRDFVNSDGKPGYFAQSLLVYGRGGNPCPECATTLKEIRMNNRSTFYCPRCQR